MKQKVIKLALLSVSLGLFSSAYGAVGISTVGHGTGYDTEAAEAQAFRSTSVSKSYDTTNALDNAYGTDGYFFYGDGTVATNDSDGTLAWVTVNDLTTINGGSVNHNDYDDPTAPIAPIVEDWTFSAIGLVGSSGVGSWQSIMSLDIAADAPTHFRLGLMSGTDQQGNGRWDPTGMRVSVDGGTAVEVTELPVTAGFVFFDITTDGTTATLLLETQSRLASQGSGLTGITFDEGTGDVAPPPPPPPVTAVVITAVPSSDGYAETNLPAFRSTDVVKLYDYDQDNIYGSEGVFFFGTNGEPGNNKPWAGNTTSTGATWVTSYDAGADFLSISEQPDYGPYDDPLLSGADVADWTNAAIAVATGGGVGLWAEVMTFTVTNTAPQFFRVGIMSGTQDDPTGKWDPTGLRLSIAGVETNTAISTVTNLANNASNLCEWVFFDVELNGEASNLTFSVEGQNRLSGQGTAISGITFDLYVDLTPPILSIETLSNTDIVVSWSSVYGLTYSVQDRESLTTGSWTTIDSNIDATPPENTYTQAAGSTVEFYQVLIEGE